MPTPSIRQILGSDIARWIQRNAKDKLSHRAQACAANAVNFLVRAENIAEISTNVSYFCATHATEEAVASFISASKASRYTEAKAVNLHDHKHKATVSAFAQFISAHAQDVGLRIALEPNDDVLLARVIGESGLGIYPLGMHLFSFNEDRQSGAHVDAFEGFASLFDNPTKMYAHIEERSSFRDRALYATDQGINQISEKSLSLLLRDHAFLTLGLIWAAIDVGQQDQREPFVVQVIGAINEVTRGFKAKPTEKVCGSDEAS
ncbi:hypothetical protein GOL78_12430 [Sinorhizobium medicae]|nr:hypothetical protein [Sinorhizobium medicae]MDX1210318.1 hypothetical protein [Sinorhizobium medicae]